MSETSRPVTPAPAAPAPEASTPETRVSFWQQNSAALKQLGAIALILILTSLSGGIHLGWALIGYGCAALVCAKVGLLCRPSLVTMILMVTLGGRTWATLIGGILASSVYFLFGLIREEKLTLLVERIPRPVRQTLICGSLLTMVLEVKSLLFYNNSLLCTIIIVVFVLLILWMRWQKPCWKWAPKILTIVVLALVAVSANWSAIGAQLAHLKISVNQTGAVADQLASWIVPFSAHFWQTLLPQGGWDWRCLWYLVAALLSLPEVSAALDASAADGDNLAQPRAWRNLGWTTLICVALGAPLPVYSIASVGAKVRLHCPNEESLPTVEAQEKTLRTVGFTLLVLGFVPALTFASTAIVIVATPLLTNLLYYDYWQVFRTTARPVWEPIWQTGQKICHQRETWPISNVWPLAVIVVASLVIACQMPIWYFGKDYLVKFPWLWYGLIISLILSALARATHLLRRE